MLFFLSLNEFLGLDITPKLSCFSDKTLSLAAPSSPVLGHGQMLQQGEPAGGQAVQAGDAVVVQPQLTEEDLVVQPGRLEGMKGRLGCE